MNIARHLAPCVAAAAVTAAALLVLLDTNEGLDAAAPLRALARAQSLVERHSRVRAGDSSEHGKPGLSSQRPRYHDAMTRAVER